MKVSMSLPEEDVHFVDEYVAQRDVASRSAAIHHAISLLRNADLADAYAQAWQEWESTGEAELWDVTTTDGLSDASR